MAHTDYSPSQRFEALAFYFGWQGGTCHQVAAAIGCKEFLSAPLADWADGSGFSAIRTCGRNHRATLSTKHQGDWPYWSNVIRGYWATGALGGRDFSERFGNA